MPGGTDKPTFDPSAASTPVPMPTDVAKPKFDPSKPATPVKNKIREVNYPKVEPTALPKNKNFWDELAYQLWSDPDAPENKNNPTIAQRILKQLFF